MKLRTYLIIVACFIVVGGVIYGLNAVPFLRIAKITVTGNELVSADTVRNALVGTAFAKPNAWSLLGDDHILFWLAKQGLTKLGVPGIQTADVAVNAESRVVQVKVKERELDGVVCTASSTDCYAFDKNGIVFAKAPQATGQLMLVIHGNASTRVQLGKEVFSADELQRFETAYKAFEANDIAIKKIQLRDEALKEWEAVLENGTVVYFDRLSLPSDLPKIISALAKRPDFNELSYIDLRVPNRVYFR